MMMMRFRSCELMSVLILILILLVFNDVLSLGAVRDEVEEVELGLVVEKRSVECEVLTVKSVCLCLSKVSTGMCS